MRVCACVRSLLVLSQFRYSTIVRIPYNVWFLEVHLQSWCVARWMVRTCVRQVSRRRRGGGNGPLLPLESEVCRGLASSEVQLRSGGEVADVQVTTQRCVEDAEVRIRAYICMSVHLCMRLLLCPGLFLCICACICPLCPDLCLLIGYSITERKRKGKRERARVRAKEREWGPGGKGGDGMGGRDREREDGAFSDF